jgi:riboflavin biosynthesis pyrimidine reductase
MDDSVMQLYPLPAQKHALRGLYLAHDMRQYAVNSGQPYVYANFVTSLDGRIAVAHPSRPGLTVPSATANDRDWRLFQELAAQADLIISSGRYLRDWADGRAQEILQVDDPRYADLRGWRERQGLSPQADIAIVSRSLRFPLPGALTAGGRTVVVFTTANHDPQRVAQIEARAGRVIVSGEESVQGEQMVGHMQELGYETIYSAAGPRILHLLLSDGVLNRIYLTVAPRLLGGQSFATIVDGDLFPTAIDASLHAVYHDPHALDGLGQLYTSYELM